MNSSFNLRLFQNPYSWQIPKRPPETTVLFFCGFGDAWGSRIHRSAGAHPSEIPRVSGRGVFRVENVTSWMTPFMGLNSTISLGHTGIPPNSGESSHHCFFMFGLRMDLHDPPVKTRRKLNYLERYELDHLPNILTTHLLTNSPTISPPIYQPIYLQPISPTNFHHHAFTHAFPPPKYTIRQQKSTPPLLTFEPPIGLAPSEIWDSHRPSGATDSISYWKKLMVQKSGDHHLGWR